MASLSASVSSLLSALNIGTSKPSDTGSSGVTDNFSALLDIGKDAQIVRDSANTDARTPSQPAAAKTSATARPQEQGPKERSLKEENHFRSDSASDKATRTPLLSQKKEEAPTAPAPEKAEKTHTESKPAAQKADAPKEATPRAKKEGEIDEPKNENTDQIAAGLDDLHQLLLSILQALGISAPAPKTQEGDASVSSDAAPELIAVLPSATSGPDTTSGGASGQQGAGAKSAEPLLPIGILGENALNAPEIPSTPETSSALLGKIAAIYDAAQLLNNALNSTDSLPAITDGANGAESNAPLLASLQNVISKLDALTQPAGTNNTASLPQALPADVPPESPLTQDSAQLNGLLQKLAAVFQPSGEKSLSYAQPQDLPKTDAPQDTNNNTPKPSALDTQPALPTPSLAQAIAEKPAANDDEKPVAQKEAGPVIAPVTNDAKINLSLTAQPVAAGISAQTATVQSSASGTGGESGNGGGQQQSSSAPAPQAGQAQNASSAYKSDFARALEQTAKNPIIEQVAFHIRTAKATGNSRITIQLNPHELGKVDVQINIASDGKTHVSITADNKNTLDILQRDAQGLARTLSDAGLQTDDSSLSFNLRGGDQQQAGGRQEEQSRQSGVQLYQKTQPEPEADLALNAISKSYVVNLADGLDIKI